MTCVRYAAAALLALASSVGVIAPATAQTPSQPAPPMMQPSAKPAAKPLKPAATTQAAAAREPDLAYGAYQRGYYVTAFATATHRVEELKDVKAMTLLGELYANGVGINRDEKKAADWYRLAAERGDREAMFALAMMHFSGRIESASRSFLAMPVPLNSAMAYSTWASVLSASEAAAKSRTASARSLGTPRPSL